MTLKWAVCMEGIIDFIGHELAEMPSNSVGKAWYASAAPAVQVEIAGLCLGVCVTGGGGPCIGQFVTDGQGRSFNFHRVGMRRFLFMWVWSWRLKSCYVPILLTSKCKVMGRDYVVEELTEDSFDGIDIALFSAGGSISKKFGPIAAEKGTIVVDNSSAFRMEHGIPLVIPEVNPHAMAHIKFGTKKGALIANPNCSTIICLMAATPLHRYAKVKRMVVSTYQAASGAGAAAMAELEQQTREVLEGKQPTCKIFNQQYAFNLFSHNSNVYPNGYNEEEMKLVRETRKIWGDDDVKVTATCIRVPVMRAHAESINLEFEKAIDEETARQILKEADGVIVIDDRDANNFPTPLEVSSKDAVAVGRVRRDVSQNGGYGLDIFVCGDQLRKGAALNAVQIAEKLL